MSKWNDHKPEPSENLMADNFDETMKLSTPFKIFTFVALITMSIITILTILN